MKPKAQLHIPKSKLIAGLFIFFGYSIGLYFLFVLVQCFLIIIEGLFYRNAFFLNHDIENFELSLAFICSISGFAEAMRFWFHQPRRYFIKGRNKAVSIYNDVTVVNWSFLAIFSRFVLVVWFLLGSFGVGSPILIFISEISWFFVLVPLVLFLQLWLSLLRYQGRRIYKWMLISGISITLLSFSTYKIANSYFERTSTITLDYDVISKYNFQLPKAQNSNKIVRKSLNIDEFYLYPSLNNDSVVLRYYLSEITLDEFSTIVSDQIQSIHPVERSLASVILTIDENVGMNYVEKLKMQLSRFQLNKIGYRLEGHPVQLNSSGQFFFEKIPPHFAMVLDNDPIPPPPPYPIIPYEHLGIKIYESPEQIRFNGELLKNKGELESLLRTEILNNSKASFYYVVVGELTFSAYLETMDLYRTVVFDLRNKYALNQFGKTYEELSFEGKREIKKEIPQRFLAVPDEGRIDQKIWEPEFDAID
jgi:hypothetical protein